MMSSARVLWTCDTSQPLRRHDPRRRAWSRGPRLEAPAWHGRRRRWLRARARRGPSLLPIFELLSHQLRLPELCLLSGVHIVRIAQGMLRGLISIVCTHRVVNLIDRIVNESNTGSRLKRHDQR